MQTNPNIPQMPLSRQSPHIPIEAIPLSERLTPRAVLALAAFACESLLTGSPHPCTFDAADLEQAVVLLRQMARTIRPAGDKEV